MSAAIAAAACPLRALDSSAFIRPPSYVFSDFPLTATTTNQRARGKPRPAGLYRISDYDAKLTSESGDQGKSIIRADDGPARAGGKTLAAARDFADGCETVPVIAAIADYAAAMKAHHSSLSLPDAIALVVAEMIDAGTVWTFDRRWRDVHERVAIP
jgi:predicted nucleic acid-binding protein